MDLQNRATSSKTSGTSRPHAQKHSMQVLEPLDRSDSTARGSGSSRTSRLLPHNSWTWTPACPLDHVDKAAQQHLHLLLHLHLHSSNPPSPKTSRPGSGSSPSNAKQKVSRRAIGVCFICSIPLFTGCVAVLFVCVCVFNAQTCVCFSISNFCLVPRSRQVCLRALWWCSRSSTPPASQSLSR